LGKNKVKITSSIGAKLQKYRAGKSNKLAIKKLGK